MTAAGVMKAAKAMKAAKCSQEAPPLSTCSPCPFPLCHQACSVHGRNPFEAYCSHGSPHMEIHEWTRAGSAGSAATGSAAKRPPQEAGPAPGGEENQHVITWQALKLSGGDGVSVSASTQSSPTEREKPGEAPQITISIKTTSTRKRKIDGLEDKGSTSASAVLVPQTPWPCARCNLEPIDTVWRPLDGATLFDTEERICGACWLVEDDRGAGRGDTEDPWELQRLHDAWLEKEFFFKKKNNGAKKMPVKGCPDCGKLLTIHSMRRHRRFYCKSRQPVALGSVQQGWPAEKDAALIERSVDLPLKDG